MRILFLKRLINYIKGRHKRLIILPKLLNKFYTYERKINETHTIILGSSHGEFGFRAIEGEMNLAISYQDLYLTYEIFEKYNNPNIKNIILFYSVFSPGYQLIKTFDAYLSIAYKIICDIPYDNSMERKHSKLKLLEEKYLKIYKKMIKGFKYDKNYLGNETKYKSDWKNLPPERRALPHYKNNQRSENQDFYVEKMAELARVYNQTIYIVLPPATQEYKALIPKSDELFKNIYEIAKKYDNIKIINCYDTEFNRSEFVDWDHLNLEGAKRLTKMIRQSL